MLSLTDRWGSWEAKNPLGWYFDNLHPSAVGYDDHCHGARNDLGAVKRSGHMTQFESFLNPFSADSLWNSYPLNPVFGTYQIPRTAGNWSPQIGEGAYSAQCFMATRDDPPMQVMGNDGTTPGIILTTGPANPDAGGSPQLTIPHWPSNLTPASGLDGHADICDVSTGVIHSFYKAKQIDGVWTASMYAWSRMDGSGWPDPAHFYQGARASGVAPCAGIIRKHEAFDGDSMFRHALCCSLDHTAMRSPYIFPAANEDSNGKTGYTGQIPMGSLLMLPPTFDTSTIENLDLRKVAETLKVYGMRVVDTNTNTPFVVYVENGTGYSLAPNGWDNVMAADRFAILDALRVATADVFVPGNSYHPNRNLNLISMRGPWYHQSGPAGMNGVYDTNRQMLIFPPTTQQIVNTQPNKTFARVTNWAPWTPGQTYIFTAHATGGATLRFGFYGLNSTQNLGDGQSEEIVFPSDVHWPTLTAKSGIGPSGSTVYGTLVQK